MATEEDVRQIALSLPETSERPSYEGTPSFRTKRKSFTRIRGDGESIVVFVASVEDKEELLASDATKFFTTPHYDGYPAVLVRFAETDVEELRELLTDSWRLVAPKRVLAAFEADEQRRSGAGG
ncbi:MAG TPA: MmcQ/YjbR family DNA-binding protein [Acidimicrobiales bacterium]|nr:MmcQ/YjbR family DNA-binding protein [Acidimicrobiales bacterium]